MNENSVQKKKLHEMTDEELKSLSDKEVEKLYMETLRKFAGVCSSMFSHIGQIANKKEQALQTGDNKSAEVLETIESFASDVLKADLTKFTEIVSGLTDDIKEKDGKALSLFDNSQSREKSFVGAMSQDARVQQENIQAKRDARYEEMIAESEKMDIPTIGGRRH